MTHRQTDRTFLLYIDNLWGSFHQGGSLWGETCEDSFLFLSFLCIESFCWQLCYNSHGFLSAGHICTTDTIYKSFEVDNYFSRHLYQCGKLYSFYSLIYITRVFFFYFRNFLIPLLRRTFFVYFFFFFRDQIWLSVVCCGNLKVQPWFVGEFVCLFFSFRTSFECLLFVVVSSTLWVAFVGEFQSLQAARPGKYQLANWTRIQLKMIMFPKSSITKENLFMDWVR